MCSAVETEKCAKQETVAASVLLVDDEPLHLDLLEASLHRLGLRLVKAGSGAEALKRVAEEDFALILLDIVMPGMDGFQTAARIRQQKRSQDTPIIFLTAHMSVEGKLQTPSSKLQRSFKPQNPNMRCFKPPRLALGV